MNIRNLTLLLLITVQDTCYGDSLHEWAESWLKGQSALFNYIHRAIEKERFPELESNVSSSFSNEDFFVTSVKRSTIGKAFLDFKATYKATFTCSDTNDVVICRVHMDGRIWLQIKHFCPTQKNYKQATSNIDESTGNKRVKLNLEDPTEKDSGLLEALEPYKKAIYDWMLKEGKATSEFTLEDVRVTKIAKLESNGLIHVQAEYTCGNKTLYGLYNIQLPLKDKLVFKVSFPAT